MEKLTTFLLWHRASLDQYSQKDNDFQIIFNKNDFYRISLNGSRVVYWHLNLPDPNARAKAIRDILNLNESNDQKPQSLATSWVEIPHPNSKDTLCYMVYYDSNINRWKIQHFIKPNKLVYTVGASTSLPVAFWTDIYSDEVLKAAKSHYLATYAQTETEIKTETKTKSEPKPISHHALTLKDQIQRFAEIY